MSLLLNGMLLRSPQKTACGEDHELNDDKNDYECVIMDIYKFEKALIIYPVLNDILCH